MNSVKLIALSYRLTQHKYRVFLGFQLIVNATCIIGDMQVLMLSSF